MNSLDLSAIRVKETKSIQPASRKSVLDSLQAPLFSSFTDADKQAFFLELNTLLIAGVDLKRSISILKSQSRSKKKVTFFETIENQLVNGVSLWRIIKSNPHFNSYETYLIEMGEETGTLPDVLLQLGVFYKRKIKQRRQITNALTYPVSILIISLTAMVFMLFTVVPMYGDIFSQFGKELPSLTKALLNVSAFTRSYIGILILCMGFIVALAIFNKEIFRKNLEYVSMKIPVINSLLIRIHLARLCGSMGLLLASKVPLMEALILVEKIVSFYPLRKFIPAIQQKLLQGHSFSEALEVSPLFDMKFRSLMRIGEESGKLDFFLQDLSEKYLEEVEVWTQIFNTILEPLIIIVLGVFVAIILVAMYLPMFQLSTSFGF